MKRLGAHTRNRSKLRLGQGLNDLNREYSSTSSDESELDHVTLDSREEPPPPPPNMRKSSEGPDELTATQPAPLEINHPLATRNQQDEEAALQVGMVLQKGVNHREGAYRQNDLWKSEGREGLDYKSSNADSRKVTHRNHKVVVLRGPVTRRKIRMKIRGAGPVVYGDAMLRRRLSAFLIRGLHDVHFSLRLEVLDLTDLRSASIFSDSETTVSVMTDLGQGGALARRACRQLEGVESTKRIPFEPASSPHWPAHINP
ncbi:hypothetical protein F5888DRAFT_1840156 [Russula emetica]|nr:hypothetical protein F5888DRAFT_1840156 [Russula emetica]